MFGHEDPPGRTAQKTLGDCGGSEIGAASPNRSTPASCVVCAVARESVPYRDASRGGTARNGQAALRACVTVRCVFDRGNRRRKGEVDEKTQSAQRAAIHYTTPDRIGYPRAWLRSRHAAVVACGV